MMSHILVPSRSWALIFEDHKIDVFLDDCGRAWFSSSDVCAVLKLQLESYATDLDEDDLVKREVTNNAGIAQRLEYISEPGLYSLVFSSQLTTAKNLKRWVMKTVLPHIRESSTAQVIPVEALRKAVAAHFLRTGLTPWVKRFPDEFYRLIFHLREWPWHGPSTPRPGVVAAYTNNIIYDRLAPGLLKELQERNPISATGRRKSRHHQWLTDDIGHPALASHFHAVINLMRKVSSWEQFIGLLNFLHPRQGNSLLLPFVVEDLMPFRTSRTSRETAHQSDIPERM